MLEMRPDCEVCGIDLPAEGHDAHICSFECTFCLPCAEKNEGRCRNCGGNLRLRPARDGANLAKHPASTSRKHKR